MGKYLDKSGLERFWASLKSLFNNKVDKVTGKGLSTNDLTDALLDDLQDAATNVHTHSNKAVLDGITSTKVLKWNNCVSPTYGVLIAEPGTNVYLTIGSSKYVRMILSAKNGETLSSLQIRQQSGTGALIATIPDGTNLDVGLEIEIIGGYIFIRNPQGELITTSSQYSSTTRINFYLTAQSSSDMLDFVYRYE
jgi:hypothetical protein